MNIISLTNKAIEASIRAGIKIREIYTRADFEIKIKDDQTPVTLADWNAHLEILEALKSTDLPVLSEEASTISYDERKNWKLFWLIDPLDGTKEFIKRNDEFTVNIALIENNQPVSGVIYAPVSGELYVGIPTFGAWKYMNPEQGITLEIIQQKGESLPLQVYSQEFAVAISRSHQNWETLDHIEQLKKTYTNVKLISRGSSLKTCMVAEGKANTYPRFGRTMEWDTAAAHALVKAVGKNIYQTDLKTELTYNKQDLQNPHFIVI